MLEAMMQLGLGFVIGFTGAAMPGPLTAFVVTNGLSGSNRFHGFVSALGHCAVEAGIIAGIVLGLMAVFDVAPFRFLNMAGGVSLIVFGAIALVRGKGGVSRRPVIVGRSAFLGGVTLSIFNGTIPVWWGTVGLQQLGFALRSAALSGALLWVVGHWMADLAWYGFLGYSSYRGRRYLGDRAARWVIVGCSVTLVVVGVVFVGLALFG